MDKDTRRKLRKFMYEQIDNPRVGFAAGVLADLTWRDWQDADVTATYAEIEDLAYAVVAEAQREHNTKGEDR